jgi:transcriptional regulator of acetoin/glycerol metabolism
MEDGALVAMLFVDSARTSFCGPNDLERVARLSRIVARLVKDGDPEPPSEEQAVVRDYLERTPLSDMEREKTLLLLDQNNWNIARVSRLMNVTRRTIYLRLARYGVTPEKARKSLRARKATG